MAIEVFTEAWSRACCERLNAHEPYRAAAAGWEGAIVMIMSADTASGLDEERGAFFDLHHGQCRGARTPTADDRSSAPYVMVARPRTWQQVLARRLDPISALIFGKLQLERGSLFTLARYTAAAREMVVAASLVDAAFPGDP